MVAKDDGQVLGRLEPDPSSAEPVVGEKRDAPEQEEGQEGGPEPKRQRVDGDSLGSDEVKPGQGSNEAALTKKCMAPTASAVDSITSPFVFLEEGFRTRWCRCPDCVNVFTALPYLLEEAALYEPPADTQAPRSVFDPIDMEALNRLPRVQVIEGLLAWNGMKCVRLTLH
jgi:E3 ubiquitin-protein ligase UBR7